MRYFGIKTPDQVEARVTGYIWWISDTEQGAWRSFFTYPSKKFEFNPYRLPMYEAIKAYEGIGYRCVELEVREKRGAWHEI